MAKTITLIECDVCGKRYEINKDGSIQGAKCSGWEIESSLRNSQTHVSVKFVRYFDCNYNNCWTTLKKQRVSKLVKVTLSEDDFVFTEDENEEDVSK